jgi:hypothetical protein
VWSCCRCRPCSWRVCCQRCRCRDRKQCILLLQTQLCTLPAHI